LTRPGKPTILQPVFAAITTSRLSGTFRNNEGASRGRFPASIVQRADAGLAVPVVAACDGKVPPKTTTIQNYQQ